MPNKASSVSNTISAEHSINILFHGGIASRQIPTNGFDDLTCEKALEECIKYIQDKVCVAKVPDQICGPKYLPTFGLLTCQDEGIWLPLNHVFKKSTEKQRTYKFRVRFRPPIDKFNDSIMSEYLFLQTLDDFLKGPLGENKNLDSNLLGRLLKIALMIPRTLPLNNADVVDENFKCRNLKIWNITSCISKELAQRFISHPIVDHFWFGLTIKKEIKCLKKDPSLTTLKDFKTEFYGKLMEAVPNYCFEEYSATSVSSNNEVNLKLVLYTESRKMPGLYYGEARQCGLEDIESMELLKPQNDEDKKWQVKINVKGPPKTLQFDKEGAAESFISMVQGYINLCLKYHLCLCKELQTASSRMREGLRSFGPLGHDTAESILGNAKRIDPNSGGFLICESLSKFGQYEVYTSRVNQSQSQTGSVDASQSIMSGVIKQTGTKLKLKMKWNEENFKNCLELRRYLKDKFGTQEFPKDYAVTRMVDINKEFEIEIIECYVTQASIVDPQGSSLPLIIKQDLKNKVQIPVNSPLVRRYTVEYNAEDMILVELQSSEGKHAKAFHQGLEKLCMLHRIKPSSFLKLYSVLLDARLSVLMEYVSLGDVLTYICKTSQSVAQKVHIMNQIAEILHVMDKENIFHGNLRLRKFMAFRSQESGFVTVKLGDPGMSYYLDTLPLDHPDNIKRNPWISPERRSNLKNITAQSEVYAVGTTLCEILYHNHQLHGELKLEGYSQTIEAYLKEYECLPCPNFLDDASESLTTEEEHEGQILVPEAKEILKLVWSIILECRAVVKEERPTSKDLLDKMKEVMKQAAGIESDTVIDKMKKVAYDLGMTEKDLKTDNKMLTLNELKSKFHDHLKEKYLSNDCINMNHKQILGKGFYGVVCKGQIRLPEENVHKDGMNNKKQWRDVAIKRIKHPEDPKLLYKEVIAACSLDHENVVKLLYISFIIEEQYEARTFDKYSPVILIMEFMNKGNLAEYAKKYKAVGNSAYISHMRNILLDVAKGMVYLSGKYIVHRDLAARNILLSEDEDGNVRAKVSDFGLARFIDDNYRFYKINTTKGLPLAWIPPECFEESVGKFSSQGDVWSFGTVMWEIFSKGSNPFKLMTEKNINQHNLLEKYKEGWRLPQQDYMSDQVYDLMKECWEEDPKKRPPFVELVQKLPKIC